MPKLSADKITEVIAYIRKEHAADPLALIQPLATGEDGGNEAIDDFMTVPRSRPG
jgi:hypothetical protein